jgi:hypothetical protein
MNKRVRVGGTDNPFDWARSTNQAAPVDCPVILAIRAAGGVFRPRCTGAPFLQAPSLSLRREPS